MEQIKNIPIRRARARIITQSNRRLASEIGAYLPALGPRVAILTEIMIHAARALRLDRLDVFRSPVRHARVGGHPGSQTTSRFPLSRE